VSAARTFVGTSGWYHRRWRGTFYPQTLAPGDWLAFYAEHLDCVELAPGRGRPDPGVIAEWCERVGAGFRFVLRAPRAITHLKKLRHCDAELQALVAWSRAFDAHLGPILFQLPERWGCNLRRLQGFVEALPPGPRYVFELRDPRWHTDAVLDCLGERGAGVGLFERDVAGPPLRPAAGPLCLRLGPPRPAGAAARHTAAGLRRWAGEALACNRTGRDVYVVFDDPSPHAPKHARKLQRFLDERALHAGYAASATG